MKYLMLAILLCVSAMLAPLAATAQNSESSPGQLTSNPPAFQGAGGGGPGGQNFEAHKQKMLDHVNQRIGELEQVVQCIQAAATPDALRECRPPQHPHPMGPGGGPSGGGGGNPGGFEQGQPGAGPESMPNQQ